MTEMIDRTDVSIYRTANMVEKDEANVPTHLWMGVSTDGRLPSNIVGAGVYVDALKDRRKSEDYLGRADSWIRTFAEENGLLHEDEDSGVPITLSQLNELLATMGCERIATVREFTFSGTITYEVGGSVFAKDEDAAREYVEQLMCDIGEPDINEPSLGDNEEWYDVAATYSDHGVDDVSYA